MGSFFGAAFIVVLPIVLDNAAVLVRRPDRHRDRVAPDLHDLRRADRLLPDRRAARHRAALVDRQGEAAPVALPALSLNQTHPDKRFSSPPEADMTFKSILIAGSARAGNAWRRTGAPSRRPRSSSSRCSSTAPAPTRRTACRGRTASSRLHQDGQRREGGINGVKITFEECETGYATDKGVECYERLKGKPGGVRCSSRSRPASPSR